MDLRTHRREPVAGGPPQQLVVLLHGLGADGRDLIGLAPELAEGLPHALFLAPDAPFPCDMAPHGRQWFSLQDWSYASMLAGLQAAHPILNAFLDNALRQAGLDNSKLALVGFSQGTMMSLYTGTRRTQPIAGIVGYSGALIWEESPAGLQKTPVHLIHGDVDSVVPVAAHALATPSFTWRRLYRQRRGDQGAGPWHRRGRYSGWKGVFGKRVLYIVLILFHALGEQLHKSAECAIMFLWIRREFLN